MSVVVTVNGEVCELPPGTTVAGLARARGARERGSAEAVGGVVVPRGEWEQRILGDGDVVELVTAVQGG